MNIREYLFKFMCCINNEKVNIEKSNYFCKLNNKYKAKSFESFIQNKFSF